MADFKRDSIMKNICFIIFLTFVLFYFPLFGNDSYVEVSGGSLSLSDLGKSNDIQMVSEVIEITLYEEFYKTTVNFEFYNSGEDQTISVGFPQWSRGTTSDLDFIDFNVTHNGFETEFTVVEIEEIESLDERYVHFKRWYIRELFFASNSTTLTSVSYNVPYGTYGSSAEYLYGTGNTWAGNIGEMTLIVNNESDKWINNIFFDSKGENFRIENENETIIIRHENITPSISDLIIMDTESIPAGLRGPMNPNPKRYWYYASVEITEDKVKYLTKEQLRLLRNLLFAAHGHTFRSDDLNAWLEEYCSSWYEPIGKVSLEEFNHIEKKNLELIQKEEAFR
jgi:hypothetical protein